MNLPIRRCLALFSAALAAAGLAVATPAPAIADPSTSFVPFSRFLSDVGRMSYATQAAAGRAGVVRDAAAFTEMRSYVLGMYQGVVVKRSFVNEEHHYFDCVTVESQPSLRGVKGKIPAAPPAPAELEVASAQTQKNTVFARQDNSGVDRYGNAMKCADGTIPMHRISMQRLTNFATVKDFLAKGPAEAGRAPDGQAAVNASIGPRRYAHGAQDINNSGGSSVLNLWDPFAYFSISQQWYIANNGTNARQTVESGSIEHPPSWGSQPVLFIYFTADNYQRTGCYNLSCSGFVQVNSNWTFGNRFAEYSLFNGPQIELKMTWQYTNGNWWLYLYRGTTADAVGYYPGTLYGGGPLSTGVATRVDYGGEVAPAPLGVGWQLWSQMGSGFVPSLGLGFAAYQRNIFTILPSRVSQWTLLTPQADSLYGCYNISYVDQPRGGAWASHLYFGGPGSNNSC